MSSETSIPQAPPPQTPLGKEIASLVDERTYAILYWRTVERKTLVEVGEELELTRERVRQLEQKAYRLLRVELGSILEFAAVKLARPLAATGCVWLDDFARDMRSTEQECRILIRALSEAKDWHWHLAKDGLLCDTDTRVNWDEQIDEQVRLMTYPIDLEDLSDRLSEIPERYLLRQLRRRYKAVIGEDDHARLGKLKQTQRYTYVLRQTNGPMAIADVAEQYEEMFGTRPSPSLVSGTLGRMENALVVDRGTYALYESLHLPEEYYDSVRNRAHAVLEADHQFLNTATLLARIRNDEDERYGFLSVYTLLGILKDDHRFVSKPGRMIGLKSYGSQVKYLPLREMICDQLKAHGPMTIDEIRANLADVRVVPEVSVYQVIAPDDQFFRLANGRYTLRDDYLPDGDTRQALQQAVEIACLAGPNSTQALANRLGRLAEFSEVEFCPELIRALVEPMTSIQLDHRTCRYAAGSPSPNLGEYMEVSTRMLDEMDSAQAVLERLESDPALAEFPRLARLDYRLASEPEKTGAMEQSVLGDILSDFTER